MNLLVRIFKMKELLKLLFFVFCNNNFFLQRFDDNQFRVIIFLSPFTEGYYQIKNKKTFTIDNDFGKAVYYNN